MEKNERKLNKRDNDFCADLLIISLFWLTL